MARTAYLLLALTTLFWGGNSVAGKLAVGHISPMLLTSTRWTLAFAVLAVFGWRHFAQDWPQLKRRLPLLVLLGGLGFTAYNLALYGALVHTTAINTSIEQAGIPMAIFALNFLLFRQKVAAGQIAGFVMAVAGVALTASHGDPGALLALDVNIGDAMMIVAVVGYAIYTVLLRFRPDVHWLSLMIALTGASALTAWPFAALEYASGAAIAPDARGWGVILYTVLFPSILSQVFYLRAVEMIGANRAGLFINLVPIFGTLCSIVLLGEALHLYHVIAMALALGGIWLAEASGRRLGAGVDPSAGRPPT